MKTEFKREMNQNYMVICPEEIKESYTLRMLSENRIAGLLPFQEKRINGESYLYFNITSKQALSRMMEYRLFKAKEIRQIAEDLIMTMTSLERFLMDGDQLALEPDLIYVNPDDFKANFCLIPGMAGSFENSFRKLSRYVLDHVDHTDGEAVILAFALFKAGEKENSGIQDLEKCLHSGENDKQILKKEQGEEVKISGEFVDERRNAGKPERDPDQERRWEEPEIRDDTERTVSKTKILPYLLGALLPVVPAAVFLIGGIGMMLQWKWIILVIWGALLTGIILSGSKDPAEKEHKLEEEEEWEVMFREEEDLERGGIPENGMEPWENRKKELDPADRELRKNTGSEQTEENEMQTVLLTGHQIYPITRRLVPENGGEEIPIRYFPFIIGKNKEITDLCLNLPQISRIHARIEEDGDGYRITDLNSTNGTSINGHFLDTNESAVLKPGETLSFADQSYRFL